MRGLLVALLVVGGCATSSDADPRDPFEPLNRGIYKFNDAVDEAVLAGVSYIRKSYQRTATISSMRFISSYRDAHFAAGWKLIDVTKLDDKSMTTARRLMRWAPSPWKIAA